MDTLNNKDAIVISSSDEENCIDRMGSSMDECAARFVENDSVLTEVPTAKLEALKTELEPIFRQAFRAEQKSKKRLNDVTEEIERVLGADILRKDTKDYLQMLIDIATEELGKLVTKVQTCEKHLNGLHDILLDLHEKIDMYMALKLALEIARKRLGKAKL